MFFNQQIYFHVFQFKLGFAEAEGASADFCIAFEGGVEEDPQGMMACFAIAAWWNLLFGMILRL